MPNRQWKGACGDATGFDGRGGQILRFLVERREDPLIRRGRVLRRRRVLRRHGQVGEHLGTGEVLRQPLVVRRAPPLRLCSRAPDGVASARGSYADMR